ncbi:response regulator [Desulfolithobacter sp.]
MAKDDPLHPECSPSSLPGEQLLEERETIVIVDDCPELVRLVADFLNEHGFPVLSADSAAGLREHLEKRPVALVLLDIGLPDGDGRELLPELKDRFPDTSIIMLTAVTDLQTALACLRLGADDYLTKPLQFTDFLQTLCRVLEKRRLTINNRRYQQQLEQVRFRIGLLHELTMKMNSAYLSMTELDEILLAILVGITAREGLGFNRAFLAFFDDEGEVLEGRLAIGPGRREDAGNIWREMRERELGFQEIIEKIKAHCFTGDSEVNRIVQAMRVESWQEDHILIRAVRERRSICVKDGQSDCPVDPGLIGLLQEESFVVVPLYSPSRALGVLIADHFVTREPITEDLIRALESFASQASLAIEHCRLHTNMERKIRELEAMTRELEKNRDMLVEAERYSALGHMAAQLAHNIRNPITSIGGTARLLARKTSDPEWLKFLNMMTREATRIEKTLIDLFSFVEQTKPVRRSVSLYQLIQKSLVLCYSALQRCNIDHELILPEPEPVLDIDPDQIGQVMVHLIRNAVEAMGGGGRLTIEVQRRGGEIAIIVRDTGSGITNFNLERATAPFFTTKTYGTGMGLTLVKRIVKDHGGRLEIQSGRGENGGTEVKVSLPDTLMS